MDGIILINKPLNCTSHDVVNKVRKICHTKKVGHCGTLDPLASGVLVLCINKATKALQFITSEDKEYIATITLGKATDTYDLEGKITSEKEYQNDLTLKQVEETLKTFLGKQKQVPPIYSAIKVNGKKLYEYARNNEKVEIEPRDIEIYSLELLSFEKNEIKIKTHCSKGTYIRSLCVDIASALGYPGVMSSLIRTKSGHFALDDCITLEELEQNPNQCIPIEEAFKDFKSMIIEDEKIVYHGKTISSSLEGQVVIKNKEGKILAIYEQVGKNTLKSVRGLW